MKRLIVWLGLLVLALAALVAAAALATARPAEPALYPAKDADGGSDIYMLYGRWTASLILPTQAVAPTAVGPAWTRIGCDLRHPGAFVLIPADQPLKGEVGAVRLRLSPKGFQQLGRRLEASFGGRQQRIAPGVFASPDKLLKARLCGPWLGELLNAAGVPTTPVLDTVPAGLSQDLVWRAGAVKLDRPGPRR